jgi:hypothetical protein
MTSPFTVIGRKYLGVICILIITVILIAGLWPFDFNPVNKVEWLQNGNGIFFYGQGMVVSRQPLNIGTNNPENRSLSIEFLVRPHKESNNNTASIVTLYDHDRELFMAGQWLSELIVRVPSVKTERQKHYREISIDDALTKDVTHFITMVSEKESTAIYINGILEKIVPDFSLLSIDKELSGRLILGNSPDGTHAWNGSFFGLAAYNRALRNTDIRDHYDAWQQHIHSRSSAAFEDYSRGPIAGPAMPVALYLFNEQSGELVHDHSGSSHDLMIPRVFQPLHRTVLEMPEKGFFFSRSNLNDIAINILGFMPFGFFVSAWLRLAKNISAARAYGITLSVGFCLSFAIEVTQVYLPTRDSSLMDVISNTIGTALGILFLHYSITILRPGES